jgi:uncharacterized protein YciI
MEFDRFSVGFLPTRNGAPERGEVGDDTIQDAHMSHLAALREMGHLLGAGPLSDGHYRGM